jgi:hypothetical protein
MAGGCLFRLAGGFPGINVPLPEQSSNRQSHLDRQISKGLVIDFLLFSSSLSVMIEFEWSQENLSMCTVP